jgi:hypothetical protein
VRRHGAGGLLAIVLLAMAWWSLGPRSLGPSDHGTDADAAADDGLRSTESRDDGEGNWASADGTEPNALGRRGRVAGAGQVVGTSVDVVEPELGGDEGAWNRLPPRARVRVLTQRFDAAVGAMEAGGVDVDLRRDAEEAVSSLRAELYATPRGKERHRSLERRLVAVLDSADPPPDSLADSLNDPLASTVRASAADEDPRATTVRGEPRGEDPRAITVRAEPRRSRVSKRSTEGAP